MSDMRHLLSCFVSTSKGPLMSSLSADEYEEILQVGVIREILSKIQPKITFQKVKYGLVLAQVAVMTRDELVALSNEKHRALDALHNLAVAAKDLIGWVPGRARWHTDATTASIHRTREAIEAAEAVVKEFDKQGADI